mmetsp:Transcript_35542/g.83002  ORF Transcript_35542/g.83002 Transcript_35542/m.83002 type:complete len:288 (+) Transcript_35542:321-1184(+)
MLRASGIHSHARLEAGCEVGKLCLQAQLGVLDFAHDLFNDLRLVVRQPLFDLCQLFLDGLRASAAAVFLETSSILLQALDHGFDCCAETACVVALSLRELLCHNAAQLVSCAGVQASDGLEAVSIGLDAVVGVGQKIHNHEVLTPDVRHALIQDGCGAFRGHHCAAALIMQSGQLILEGGHDRLGTHCVRGRYCVSELGHLLSQRGFDFHQAPDRCVVSGLHLGHHSVLGRCDGLQDGLRFDRLPKKVLLCRIQLLQQSAGRSADSFHESRSCDVLSTCNVALQRLV